MADPGISVLFLGNNFERLIKGLWVGVRISFFSLAFAIFSGVFLGVMETAKGGMFASFNKNFINTIRIIPQLAMLFLAYFGLSRLFGINLSGEFSSIIVFSLWGASEMTDLVRGLLKSIPKSQYDGAFSLGLKTIDVYRGIIIPQIIKPLLPQTVNLATRIIKSTSLIVLIGVVEILKVGQQIIESNRRTVPDCAFWIYAIIMIMYFFTCWPISMFSKYLEFKNKIEE